MEILQNCRFPSMFRSQRYGLFTCASFVNGPKHSVKFGIFNNKETSLKSETNIDHEGNNNPALYDRLTLTDSRHCYSSSPACDETELDKCCSQRVSDPSSIKSGTLVMICSHHQKTWHQRLRSKSCPNALETYGHPSQRCPVIAQVHKRTGEHFAVIRKTKRGQSQQPLYLKLTNCRIVSSTSAPSQFTVHVNGAEGRSFTFEASSPEVAKDWVSVFTPASPSAFSELITTCRASRPRKPLSTLNPVILEEEEETQQTETTSFSVGKQSHNQQSHNQQSHNQFQKSNIHSSDKNFQRPNNVSTLVNKMDKYDLFSNCSTQPSANNLVRNNSFPSDKTTFSKTGTREEQMNRVSISFEELPHDLVSKARTMSMPVLYEEEEDVASE